MNVTEEEKRFVTTILVRACKTLSINLDLIRIEFDGIGDCFKTTENAAVSNDTPHLFIKINLEWLRTKRKAKDFTTIRDILYHEIRHIYQFREIANLKNGFPIYESKEIILNWINDRKHYISFSSFDATTHIPHFSQSIELDAMAFSVLLRSFDSQKENYIENGLAIPDEIWPLVEKRVREMENPVQIAPPAPKYV